MSKINKENGQIGNTESVCPYCTVKLEKFPLRKTKCPTCRNDIFSRTRPFDLKKVLLTEKDAEVIEYQWAVEKDSESFPTLENYYFEKEIETNVLNDLQKSGQPFSKSEIKNKTIATKLIKSREKDLLRYKESGLVKGVKVLATYNSCKRCQDHNNTFYLLENAPNPPVKDCEDDWCRCGYIAILHSDM